ncbi:MAG TPA: YlbF family regulator [Clostridia bacterium]|nr:YlbF family regulator [Clostridia bacterium]
MNVYDKAYELANAIRQMPEYKAFKEAYEKINKSEENKKMLEDFRKKQLEIQAKELSGEKVDAKEKEVLEKLWEILNLNPEISSYLSLEYTFGKIMDDILKIVMEPMEMK